MLSAKHNYSVFWTSSVPQAPLLMERRLHCIEVASPPNPWGMRALVHLCIEEDVNEGEDIVCEMGVDLDRTSLSESMAAMLAADPAMESRLLADIARATANEYLARRVDITTGPRARN